MGPWFIVLDPQPLFFLFLSEGAPWWVLQAFHSTEIIGTLPHPSKFPVVHGPNSTASIFVFL